MIDASLVSYHKNMLNSPAHRIVGTDPSPLLDAVLNTATNLVLFLDAEGRIVRFNRACEQLTGYSEHQVFGRRRTDPDGADRVA